MRKETPMIFLNLEKGQTGKGYKDYVVHPLSL